MNLQLGFNRIAQRPGLPRRSVRLRLTLLYGLLFLLCGTGLLAITYLLVRHALASPIRASRGGFAHHPAGGIVRAPTAGGLQAQQSADLHQLLVQSGIALAIMAVVSILLGWLVAGRVLKPLRTMTAATRRISEQSLHQRLGLAGPSDELKDLGDTIDGLLGRLEAAFESQRRFVANASHELRTPLMLTQTMLQVALADPELSFGSLRDTCEEVIASGRDQAQLIEALLTLARSQQGLGHRESVDLAAVAAGVLQDAEAAATAAGLTIHSTLDRAVVAGDERLLRALVLNLVNNAIRHNKPDGSIELLVTTQAERPLINVSNTGSPVAADQIDRLLQPFQRLDGRRSSDRDGFGLGLSIVAAVAQGHAARLTIAPRVTGGMIVELAFPPAMSGTPQNDRPYIVGATPAVPSSGS
jgi:signal transduction histidine kinase